MEGSRRIEKSHNCSDGGGGGRFGRGLADA